MLIKIIDGFLLNRIFQPFTVWLQIHTGYTNFAVAYFCAATYCITAIAAASFANKTVVGFVDVCFIGLPMFGFSRAASDFTRKAVKRRCSNPLRVDGLWLIMRFTFLGYTIFDALLKFNVGTLSDNVDICQVCNHASLAMFFYIVSCTPLPPKEADERAMMESVIAEGQGS